MQITLFDFFLIFVFFALLIFLIKSYNKFKLKRNRKCAKDEELLKHPSIVENSISFEDLIFLYNLIEKYFHIERCYLNPNDRLSLFLDNDSFNFHEAYESFSAELSELNVEVLNDDKLIDLLIKLTKRGPD